MSGRVIAELVRKPTRSGDSFYFVGVAGSGSERTRITVFFLETRTNDADEVVEIWELRAEPFFAPPSWFERAPPPSRRVGAARNGQRPGASSGP